MVQLRYKIQILSLSWHYLLVLRNELSTVHFIRCFFYMRGSFEPRHNKTNNMSVRPAKTQISLGIRPVWPESLLCAQWVAKDPSVLHADSEDSDQTGRMPRLIWVFNGTQSVCWFCHVAAHFRIICHVAGKWASSRENLSPGFPTR